MSNLRKSWEERVNHVKEHLSVKYISQQTSNGFTSGVNHVTRIDGQPINEEDIDCLQISSNRVVGKAGDMMVVVKWEVDHSG